MSAEQPLWKPQGQPQSDSTTYGQTHQRAVPGKESPGREHAYRFWITYVTTTLLRFLLTALGLFPGFHINKKVVRRSLVVLTEFFHRWSIIHIPFYYLCYYPILSNSQVVLPQLFLYLYFQSRAFLLQIWQSLAYIRAYRAFDLYLQSFLQITAYASREIEGVLSISDTLTITYVITPLIHLDRQSGHAYRAWDLFLPTELSFFMLPQLSLSRPDSCLQPS